MRVINHNTTNFVNEDKTPDKIILTESELRSLISSLVLESLSISQEVFSVSNQIVNEVERNILQNSQSGKTGEFETIIFGRGFIVKWELHNVYSINKPVGASINLKERILTVDVIERRGEIDKLNLSDALQHEIEHLYQVLLKPNEKMFNDKDSALYDKSLELMANGGGGFKRLVGRAVYLMFNAEQDAYVNGLYAQLSRVDKRLIDSTIEVSDAKKHLSFLRRFNEQIHKEEESLRNDEGIIESLEYLKRDYKWLKRNVNKAIIRFARKIAHIERKIKDEN